MMCEETKEEYTHIILSEKEVEKVVKDVRTYASAKFFKEIKPYPYFKVYLKRELSCEKEKAYYVTFPYKKNEIKMIAFLTKDGKCFIEY